MQRWDDGLIVVDSREQLSYWPEARQVTLMTGDYSVAGYEGAIAVERKSANDLFSSLGGTAGANRKRLLRAFRRLSLMPFGAFVVESSIKGLYGVRRFGRITPAHAVGTLTRWSAVYRVPVIWADDRTTGKAMTKLHLRLAWEELQAKRHDPPVCPCGGGAIVPHDDRWVHEEV